MTRSLVLLAFLSSIQNFKAIKGEDRFVTHLSAYEEKGSNSAVNSVGSSLNRLKVHGYYAYSPVRRKSIAHASSPDVQPARASAEGAISEAERLRGEWKKESLLAAIEKYEESIFYSRLTGDQRKEADALNKIAEIFGLFGLNREALSRYSQALKLSRFTKDRSLQTEILNSMCSIYAFQGEKSKALQSCDEARRLSQLAGDPRGEAQALNNIGEAHYFSDMKQALSLFQQALTLSRTANAQRTEAQALTNIGYVQSDLSNLQEASTYFDQALNLWRRIGDPSGEARTINALGVIHSKLGEKQKALDEHTTARDFFQRIGNRSGELTAFTGIGFVYDSLGQKEKALDQYRKALDICRAVGQREGELVLLIHIGNAQDALGATKDALKSYDEALNLSTQLGDKRMQAYSLNFIGQISDSTGLTDQALSYYVRALHLSRSVEDRMGEASVLNKLGNIFERWGKRDKALNYYNSALALLIAMKDRQGEAFTRYNLSRTYYDQGEFDEAKSQIETSLNIIESLRTNVGSHELRVSYFASVHQYYSLYIDLLMQMHNRYPAQNLTTLAFQADERARTRNLLDLLTEAQADIYESIDPILREKERTLRQTLDAKAERQIRLLSGKHANEEVLDLEKEISDLTFAYEEVRAQIRERSPRHAALTDPPPLSLKDVQEMLDDNTLLLEYALGEKRSYLWAISKSAVQTFELPAGRYIEEGAQGLYNLLASRHPIKDESLADYEARGKQLDEQYWIQANELSQVILEPARSLLGTKRLLIVADGTLQLIPFGALSLSGSNDASGSFSDRLAYPLVLEHEVVNLPSMSALFMLRRMNSQRPRPLKDILVLADPVFERDDPRVEASPLGPSADKLDTKVVHQASSEAGLIDPTGRIPRLLASAEEAREITSIAKGGAVKVVGVEANLDTLKVVQASQFRIVHFATHGVFNNEHPELSGIILSLYDERGQPRPGFLRLHEIYNLNLPVQLVVLSACNTALGKEVRGEGLIGLTRGFMYAGAAGTIASLWKVDDDATAELMTSFYEALLKDGLSPSAALRKAQIKMWETDRRRSPYYWAAFVLHGEYQQSSSAIEVKRSRIVGAAIAILVVFIIALYGLRRGKRVL